MNTSNVPYNCVILDDEAIMIKIIERYISNIENLKLVGSFTSPVEMPWPLLNITSRSISFF